MTRSLRALSLTSGLVLATTLAVACGGSDSSNGLGADGGPGGNGGDGGPSLFNNNDGGVILLGDAACVSSSAGAALTQVMLVFMFDRSGSMSQQSKWPSCSAGLEAFFGDPSSAGLWASLQFFEQPNQCDVNAYAAPLVPMMALPNPNPFNTAINATSPSGETPTLPALQGAAQYAQQIQQQNPSAKVAIVLVTDGEPNVCGSTIQAVAGEAQTAAAAKIPTYVIGIGNVTNLNSIAAAGGTGQAFIVSTTNPQQTVSDFESALATIRGNTLTCNLTIPAPPNGQTINYGEVNVIYTPSGGQAEVLLQNPTCGGGGTGWQYDKPQAPTHIQLCPASCATVQADKQGKLEIAFGCATASTTH